MCWLFCIHQESSISDEMFLYMSCPIPFFFLCVFLKILVFISQFLDIVIYFVTFGNITFVISSAFLNLHTLLCNNFVPDDERNANYQMFGNLGNRSRNVLIFKQIICSIPFLICCTMIVILLVFSLIIECVFYVLTMGRDSFEMYDNFKKIILRMSEIYKIVGVYN